MPALKDALSELDNISQQLNEESDSVNDLIATVEGGINQSKPGVEAWLNEYEHHEIAPTSFHDDDRGCDCRSFWVVGYGLDFRGDWRVLARQDEVDGEDEQTVPRSIRSAVPLAECPRNIRIEAAPLLEALVNRVAERAAMMLESLREAKAKVE